MIAKPNDLQLIEKKVITKPIDYATLNQLSTDFNTRFVPQTESYAEQAFWSQYSVQTDEPTHSGTTIVAVLKELPKVSMNSTLPALQDDLILSVIEQLKTQVVTCTKINQDNKQSAQTVHMLTKPQVFYNHATRQALGFQNPRYLKNAQQFKPNLYDGSVIGKSNVIMLPDSENTLMHAEESRSKMIAK
nr:hypothetical protein [Tanacetum cinerariifolium]